MHDYSKLTLATEDGIALATVNRPEALNALNAEVLDELEHLFDELAALRDISAVILTGSGSKAFVGGADIRELSRLDAPGGREFARRGQRLLAHIEAFDKPVIAAVNGYCLGGGCELAMACHVRIAARGARFGQPEVKLGLIPGYGGTQRLPRLVGEGRALELLLSGEMISAEEALRIGLVSRVVEDAELIPACTDLAARIMKNGPVAIRACLDAVRLGRGLPLDRGQAIEAALFGLVCGSEDMKEGTRAFIEKREAAFKGR
ncbi:MAG: enoyl-CoA hydratase-related protein [Acidobacteriota bacterium]